MRPLKLIPSPSPRPSLSSMEQSQTQSNYDDSKYVVKYNDVKTILKQMKVHVFINQIQFFKKQGDDKNFIIEFFWFLISPHLEGESKAKLIRLFLETCVLLQIYDQGFFHLEGMENKVKGILEIEEQIIEN
mmetsp:Transcript_2284/g.3450  ORF Transcript_2284/g.3450 Transcript_2284/m.3450 type:complete len:131 (+) Transcript_2284:417-809(+)